MKSIYLTLALLLPATALVAGRSVHPAPAAAQPSIAAGSSTSFAIDREGTAFLWGLTKNDGEPYPWEFTAVPVTVMPGIRTIATGFGHTLLLDTAGNVHAMGNDGNGQLGTGETHDFSLPLTKTLGGVKAIAAASGYSIFLKKDGTVWTCGSGDQGQLGNGTGDYAQPTLRKIMTGVQAISAGSSHSLFLKNDGSVWGTGANSQGELGDGTTINRLSPIHVMDGVEAISAGGGHSLFLKKDGSVWGTGGNAFGQLGVPTSQFVATPILVMRGVKAISAGSSTSFFIKPDGSLWARGYNYDGLLGAGTAIYHPTPVRVLMGVTEVAGGIYHTVARKKDGSVWAAGSNYFGNIGDGTFKNRHQFVKVPAFSRPAGPEIEVRQPAAVPLVDGESKKSFGTSAAGRKGAVRTFIITNKGNRPLTGLSISTNGAAPKDFITSPLGDTILQPGKSTTFKVTFKPTKTGARSAAIHIASNDEDESKFDIKLSGFATIK